MSQDIFPLNTIPHFLPLILEQMVLLNVF